MAIKSLKELSKESQRLFVEAMRELIASGRSMSEIIEETGLDPKLVKELARKAKKKDWYLGSECCTYATF